MKFGYGFNVLKSGTGMSKGLKLLNIVAIQNSRSKTSVLKLECDTWRGREDSDRLIARVYRSLFSPSSDNQDIALSLSSDFAVSFCGILGLNFV